MSREEFLERHRHEFMGYVCTAMERRDGPRLAEWLREVMKKVDGRLAAIYHELTPPAPVNGNGKTTQLMNGGTNGKTSVPARG